MEHRPTLGTLLRHLIDILDGAVEQSYARSGLDYRPRFTAIVRSLIELGPSSIRTISRRAGVTHSAVSQTVSQMASQGLVKLKASGDARERIVSLTSKAEAMIPTLEEHWAATNAAAQALDAELAMPLTELVSEAIQALERRPFLERIDRAARRKRK
ncbi:MAG TPA: MarR family transcriptional regulator [Candidatus Angelobacter sp.]|nr:MarR family transcriptional regulator [Candidatus Angelobacter sp.]